MASDVSIYCLPLSFNPSPVPTPSTRLVNTPKARNVLSAGVTSNSENANMFLLALADEYSVSSSEDENHKDVVSIDTWLKRKDLFAYFPCNEVSSRGYMLPR